MNINWTVKYFIQEYKRCRKIGYTREQARDIVHNLYSYKLYTGKSM